MSSATHSLELSGVDGANPLGFLAALGTLVTARAAGEMDARLFWRRGRTWVPVLDALSVSDQAELSEKLAEELRGRTVAPETEKKREAAQRALDEVTKSTAKKRKEIKERGLSRDERRAAIEAELAPLERVRDLRRAEWLAALRDAVPRPELALGRKVDCTANEYREHMASFLEGVTHTTREPLDFFAAFGTDACRDDARPEQLEPTPFCFIKGSGHQFFLDTVRQLVAEVAPERVRQTLFEVWAYRDETLSMRWDPIEDRRYALLDRDPTASDNKSRTVWMANLLAYRGLTLFPCAPTSRGLGTTAWLLSDEDIFFIWPIWDFAASPDTIRSLLQLRELTASPPNRTTLRARGIAEVFHASRIKVGSGSNYKLNFTSSRRVV